MTIRVERLLPGRRVRGSCVARPTRQRAPRCTRVRAAGRLTRRQAAGAAAVAFSGRIGARALPAGRYRVTIQATDAAGNLSLPRRVGFAIVAG